MMKNLLRISAVVLVAATVAVLQRSITRYEIVDRSMQPALEPGDYVFVDLRPQRQLPRGSIIVYPDRSGIDLVKRVVGLAGDLVEIRDGTVHIDGTPLADPWASTSTEPDGTWVLDHTEVFTLGDARSRSTGDSRVSGGIPIETIRGRVTGIYWPPSRAGNITR